MEDKMEQALANPTPTTPEMQVLINASVAKLLASGVELKKEMPLSPLDGGDVPDETGGAGVSKLVQTADPLKELLGDGK